MCSTPSPRPSPRSPSDPPPRARHTRHPGFSSTTSATPWLTPCSIHKDRLRSTKVRTHPRKSLESEILTHSRLWSSEVRIPLHCLGFETISDSSCLSFCILVDFSVRPSLYWQDWRTHRCRRWSYHWLHFRKLFNHEVRVPPGRPLIPNSKRTIVHDSLLAGDFLLTPFHPYTWVTPSRTFRGGAGPRGALSTLSQYMLSSAATFGFFLSIGSVSLFPSTPWLVGAVH